MAVETETEPVQRELEHPSTPTDHDMISIEEEEVFMSSGRRARLMNRQRRRVYVVVRVRPFVPNEEPVNVVASRGDNLLLVKPDVLSGAPPDLVADMVLAASAAEIDLNDWARSFRFNHTYCVCGANGHFRLRVLAVGCLDAVSSCIWSAGHRQCRHTSQHRRCVRRSRTL